MTIPKSFKEYLHITETTTYLLNVKHETETFLEDVTKYAKRSRGRYFIIVEDDKIKYWRKKYPTVSRRFKAFEDTTNLEKTVSIIIK